MSFLTPGFLLFSLLAGPIIIMYMLRLRRQEMMVSSTLLWQKLLRDREANAPWQRLRRNLLLLLQLLILAALVLALARPFYPIPSISSGNVVVLLDSSASMQATDVEPNRFTAAKAEVGKLIDDLGGSSQMSIIQAGHMPSVLVSATGDKNTLRLALDKAVPDASPAEWPAAFALAAGAAQGFQDAQIVLVSDGGLPQQTPPLPAETIFVPVGVEAENLAISALATRGADSGPQLFASVSNQGLVEQQALFSLTLDGVLFDSRRITVAAGKQVNLSWDLPQGTAVIKASLSDNENDFLPLDNTAWAVHEGGVSNRALLVTPGNIFLEQIFSSLPGIELFKSGSSDLSDSQPYDLYIYDSVPLPDPVPAADMLILNPMAGFGGDSSEDSLLEVTGVFTSPATVATRLADSPLLRFVDWRNVHVASAKQISAPWAQPLVMAAGGPLIMTGERNGLRAAVFSFDLHDSDLPLQIAFPVLMANITDWLSPGRAFEAPANLRIGTPVAISPGVGSLLVTIRKPDGREWLAQVGEDDLFFTETDQLGLYQVVIRDDGGDRPAGSFAVNLFSPDEGQIQPADQVRIGQSTLETAVEGDIGQRELWPWLLLAAFVILLIEWWIHHRGTRLPKLQR